MDTCQGNCLLSSFPCPIWRIIPRFYRDAALQTQQVEGKLSTPEEGARRAVPLPGGLSQFVPLQLCVEGLAVDFEDSGGLALVAFHQFQHLLDMGLFDNPEGLC